MKKNETYMSTEVFDMRGTGGPLIPSGTKFKVLKVERSEDGRVWVNNDQFGTRSFSKKNFLNGLVKTS